MVSAEGVNLLTGGDRQHGLRSTSSTASIGIPVESANNPRHATSRVSNRPCRQIYRRRAKG